MPATIDTSPGAGIVPASTKGVRVRSADLADHPVPGGREEDWRFTPLKVLRPLLDGAEPSGEIKLDWQASGAEVTMLTGDAPQLGRVLVPYDRTSAVTAARASGGLHVRVPPETTGAEVSLVVQGVGETAYQRILVEVAHHASAAVVLDYRGTATLGSNVEFDVADGAELTVLSIHDWDLAAVHAATHGIRVGRDARVKHIVVSLGGMLVRSSVDVAYAGPGGEIDLLGVFFPDARQHLEHRLFVDHAVPECTSHVEYRGALQGDPGAGAAGIARSVWIGDVLIRAEAVGTSTYELNRNLVLTDAARADSVPNLEIETGEIRGAGHASATGRFDDEQLFYLQARGIPPQEARRLVVRGFFTDLVRRFGLPEMETRVLAALSAELGHSDPRFAALEDEDYAEGEA